MNRRPTQLLSNKASAPAAVAPWALPLACLIALSGCSSISETLSGNKVDYRAGAARAPTVEVPPDLTQLQTDPRYQRATGAPVSANVLEAARAGTAAAPATAAVATTGAAAAPQSVVLTSAKDLRVVRIGNERWLVTSQTPEEVWPKLREFWQQAGFTLAIDKPAAGVMETEWKENRAKVSNDIVRRTIGAVFDALFDSGERDRYRTRVERGANNSTEITISHRGMTEQVIDPKLPDATRWVFRPSEPSLEAEMMAQLLVALSAGNDGLPAGKGYAAAKSNADAQVAAAAATPSRARVLDGRPVTTVQVDDDLERAWRRVGIALDRSGFTIEDRDRSQAVYQVRYVDPKLAGQEEPGLFARLFGAKRAELTGVRYALTLKADGKNATLVQVQEDQAAGAVAGNAANARAIADLLVAELR